MTTIRYQVSDIKDGGVPAAIGLEISPQNEDERNKTFWPRFYLEAVSSSRGSRGAEKSCRCDGWVVLVELKAYAPRPAAIYKALAGRIQDQTSKGKWLKNDMGEIINVNNLDPFL